jgi:hypothetical protein
MATSAEAWRIVGEAKGVWNSLCTMSWWLGWSQERREPAVILAEMPANANRRDPLLSAVRVN